MAYVKKHDLIRCYHFSVKELSIKLYYDQNEILRKQVWEFEKEIEEWMNKSSFLLNPVLHVSLYYKQILFTDLIVITAAYKCCADLIFCINLLLNFVPKKDFE